MNRFLGILVVLLLSPLPANAEAPRFAGSWVVTRHLDATELSPAPAVLKQYRGKSLVVGVDSVAFAGEDCRIENSRQMATDDEARSFFLREFKADYNVLKLAAPIAIVETHCNILVGDSENRIVFDWDGNFFEARRAASRERQRIKHSSPPSSTHPAVP